MEKYKKEIVENMLRNYTSLSVLQDAEYMSYKMDLENALRRLSDLSDNLYQAITGVLIMGVPIQEQAAYQNVSKRQTLRRLDDGVHMLTLIMNGEVQ